MKIHLLVASLVALVASSTIGAPPNAIVVSTTRIWDAAPHNAFTDLVRWQDAFWCAFREGRGHVSTDGKIRVLRSADGEKWESAALIELAGFDLRDAALSVMPDGRLMLIGGAAPRKQDNESAPTGSFVAFSEDGRDWTTPHIAVEPGSWLWRVAWHDDRAYGIAYGKPEADSKVALLASDDGISFAELPANLLNEGYPTEAALRFADDGSLLVLQRRDGNADVNSAFLGRSRPPYKEWTWTDLGHYVGGPALLQLPDGEWIAAGRRLTPEGPRTVLWHLDVDKAKLSSLAELPSGGDCSYPGLVWHDGHLWMSYYSSHEGKSNIYLAKIRLE